MQYLRQFVMLIFDLRKVKVNEWKVKWVNIRSLKERSNREQENIVKDDKSNLDCYKYRWKPCSLSGITLLNSRNVRRLLHKGRDTVLSYSPVEWRIISYCLDNSTTFSCWEFIGAHGAPYAIETSKATPDSTACCKTGTQTISPQRSNGVFGNFSAVLSLTVGAIKSKHRNHNTKFFLEIIIISPV